METQRNISAFLLHRRPYRERGVWLSAFTYEFGRLAAITRRSSKPFANTLIPLQPLVMEFSGSGELKTLRQVEPVSQLKPLRGMALYCGFYINELLYRLLPLEQPQPELFSVYVETLHQLSTVENLEPALRAFEAQLLNALGYELHYPALVSPNGQWQYRPDSGEFEALSPGTVAAAPGATGPYSAELIGALASKRLDEPAAARAIKELHRARLDFMLGGRVLKSRELIRQFWEVNREKKRPAGSEH